MNSKINITILSDGMAYIQTKSLKEMMEDLARGRQECLDEWITSDKVYDPFDFKVTNLKFNNKMEPTNITLRVDD